MSSVPPLSFDELETRYQYANQLVEHYRRPFDTLQVSSTPIQPNGLLQELAYHEDCLVDLQFGLVETKHFNTDSWGKLLAKAGAAVIPPERSLAYQQSKSLFVLVVGNPVSYNIYKRIGKAAGEMRIIDELGLLHVLYALGVSLPYPLDPNVRLQVEAIKTNTVYYQQEQQEQEWVQIDDDYIDIVSDDSQDERSLYHKYPRQAV